MYLIQIHNHCAGVPFVTFVAFTKAQASIILHGYSAVYSGDFDVLVRVNGRVLFDGDMGTNAFQSAINRKFRKSEGF